MFAPAESLPSPATLGPTLSPLMVMMILTMGIMMMIMTMVMVMRTMLMIADDVGAPVCLGWGLI